MEVINIEIKENLIKYQGTIFEELISNNKHLLPNINKKTISFTLLNSSCEFANAVRRVITEELDVKILHVDITNIHVDDKEILSDVIKDRIEYIPINQNINDTYKFKLNNKNNTLNIQNIYTKDLLLLNGNDDISKLFNTNVKICDLNSNKYITINDITITKNKGYYNAKHALCTVKYKIINTDFKIPTLNNDNTDFEFAITTNANIEPLNIIKNVVLNLEQRLDLIKINITNYNKINNPTDLALIESTDLYIIKNYDIYSYYINEESHTIGGLISKYIYNLEISIELVNYCIEHPNKRQLIINIKHNEHKELILKAISNIKKDLHLFQSYFD
jgi:DNA-directed RNA polymerase subunit L